jgi:hypothetical protein
VALVLERADKQPFFFAGIWRPGVGDRRTFIQQFAYSAFDCDGDENITLDDVQRGAFSENGALDQTLCLLLCKLDYRRSEKRYCAEKLSIAFSLILQLHHQIGCFFGTPLSINILAIGHLELPVRGSTNIAPAPHLAIDRFPWATSDCGEAGRVGVVQPVSTHVAFTDLS